MNTAVHFPLTAPQHRIWYLEQLYPNTGISVISVALRLRSKRGSLDPNRLEQCVHRIMKSSRSLNYRIIDPIDSAPYQYLHPYASAPIEHINMMECDQRAVDDWLQQRSKEPMEWNHAPLYQFSILTRPQELLLFIRLHHIISDGITIQQFIDDIVQVYSEHDQETISLIERPSYTAYMESEARYNESKRKLQDEQFWLNYMTADREHMQDMMLEQPSARILEPEAGRYVYPLSNVLNEQIKAFCAQSQWSISTLFTALFLLHHYYQTSNPSQVVGITISNRTTKQEKEMPGMCVSVLPLRMKVESEQSASSFISAVSQEQFKLARHQRYPYNELVSLLREQAEISHSLFNLSIEYRMTDSFNQHGHPELEYEWEHIHSGYEENDLLLRVHQIKESGEIRLQLDYRKSKYTYEDIKTLVETMMSMIEQVIQEPERKISQLELCTARDKLRIAGFNDTQVEYDFAQNVAALFSKQAKRSPNAPAVISRKGRLTYRELEESSDQLAASLISLGVKQECVVAILTRRTPQLLVAMLAVWKAGGACLPIDPQYPDHRIRYMLEDSEALVALIDHQVDAAQFPLQGMRICVLSDMASSGPMRQAKTDSQTAGTLANVSASSGSIQPEQLAYLIYTSGSTGTPKGVMIEHQSFSNTLQWRAAEYSLKESDVVLPVLSAAFDGFFISYWTPLIAGGAVVLPDEDEMRDLTHIPSMIPDYEVNHLVMTPTLFQAFTETAALSLLAKVQCVTLAGERISNALLTKVNQNFPSMKVMIEYGPTENSVVTTIKRDAKPMERYSIGRPIANQRIYILNDELKLQPIGMEGMLYIAGAGLARGYYGRPDLTEERFLSGEAINKLGEERLYQTGDLGYWLPNGEIAFTGRVDHQLKIRGHRLELGEIEAALQQYPYAETAAVLAHRRADDEEYQLAAFVVGRTGLDIEACRSWLQERLPSYMIPTTVIALTSMPKTPNGKRDDHALLKLAEEWEAAQDYTPPHSREEQLLAMVWEDVLHIQPIGVMTSFWDLGGDSIKVMHVSASLHASGFKLKVQDVYRYPTIRELAIRLEPLNLVSDLISTPKGEVPLTPMQAWFWRQPIVQRDWWNQGYILRFHDRCNPVALKQVLDQLVIHHDSLRLSFSEEGKGKVVQRYRTIGEGTLYSYDQYDLRGHREARLEMQQLATRVQRKTGLKQGPLVAAALFQLDEGDELLLTIHHLVVDGYSWRMLLEDIAEWYEQAVNGITLRIKSKTDDWGQWSRAVQQYANDEAILKQMEYWHKVEKTPSAMLPLDKPIGSNRICDVGHVGISFTQEETDFIIRRLHNLAGTDVLQVLLGALGLALRKWCGGEMFLLDIAGHGRQLASQDRDVSRTVGWFTCIYPIVLSVPQTADPTNILQRVRKSLQEVPDQGISYGVIKYLRAEDNPYGETLGFVKPSIFFNYMGQFGHEADNEWFQLIDNGAGLGQMLHGDNERAYEIEFVAKVMKGILYMNIFYSRKQISDVAVTRLANNYKAELLRIANAFLYEKKQSANLKHDLGTTL
ncbi:non-ribosomal peptide synthetase [Paenibacillus sp. 1001270B_150601_E10]|uniref:non-ribosomal peptide synthetase n=1 Tax=Paenibacillus sp. 1001270B_150601_E10 TaxID=2787079 RepID=UPI00189CE04D|nr:non-ribosomal peptide synthetase [Paenibacillus sp. 1001270B_150601_E10]